MVYEYVTKLCYFFIESCADVSCAPGRRCVVRGGRARCVCAAACRRVGAVCGSDGKTYTSLCRLRRRACRRPAKHLVLDYPGPCQGTSIQRAGKSSQWCKSTFHYLLNYNENQYSQMWILKRNNGHRLSAIYLCTAKRRQWTTNSWGSAFGPSLETGNCCKSTLKAHEM